MVYRLTTRNCARLFHHVLIYIGDGRPEFFFPALNLSILDVGILIKVQQVRLKMFSTSSEHGPSACCPPEFLALDRSSGSSSVCVSMCV